MRGHGGFDEPPSPDIAMGVDKALEAREGALTDALDTGAGNQGMMLAMQQMRRRS